MEKQIELLLQVFKNNDATLNETKKALLNLLVVAGSLLTDKDLDFESWVNNHFKEVNKRFENIVNPTVTYNRQDLIIIYGYLGDREIAN